MHKFVWFSSRIKTYNKFIGQLDFVDQILFIKIKNLSFGEIKIDKNNKKDTENNQISFLNLEWNCNQKIQKSAKITLRKDNLLFFFENCLNFLIVNHNFQSRKTTDFLFIKLNESKNWTSFFNHIILSNLNIFKTSQEKYVLLCIHEKKINYLSSLTINWFPKIL